MNTDKLQSTADNLGTLAAQLAAAFLPGSLPYIEIARQAVSAAEDLIEMIGDEQQVDQTTLKAGLQKLIDEIELHAAGTLDSLGPEPTA